MKVTITWSAWMTLTSFPELAIGDNGDDKDESGDEKVKVEPKNESDNYMVSMDDIDKLSGVGHPTDQPLAPWNNHWVHCLGINKSCIYLHLFSFIIIIPSVAF